MSDEYVKDEEIIETSWKCSTCGHANRGRDMKCASCGSPKDESSAYAVDAAAAEVTDAEQVADAQAGEHWVCAFCEKQNRGRVRICKFCGADQRREKKAGAPPPAAPGRSKLKGCLVVAAVLVAVLGFLYWLGSPKKLDTRVVALEWEQALQLKTKTRVHHEDWHDKVPADALSRVCKDRHRSDRQVVDHYRSVQRTRQVRYQSGSHEECRTETEDLGNGYAKRKRICKQVPEYDYRTEHYTEQEPVYRKEPVYEPFCGYDVWEWPVSRTARRDGSGNRNLAWPDPSEVGERGCRPCAEVASGPEGQTCCDRVGNYRVLLQSEKKSGERVTYQAKTPEEFAGFAIGQERRVQVDDDKVSLLPDD